MYRELEASFNITLALMPNTLQVFTKQCWSLNTSGMEGTNEGPVFKLEDINKALQSWLPFCPSGDDWLQTCGLHDELMHLRRSTFSRMGMDENVLRRK